MIPRIVVLGVSQMLSHGFGFRIVFTNLPFVSLMEESIIVYLQTFYKSLTGLFQVAVQGEGEAT